MTTRFDVILPTVGRESLFQAIDSVKSQTYPHWKLWIIGDGLAELSNWYIPNDKIIPVGSNFPRHNDSGAWARNAGISMGSNEWIAYLDDDDQWYPNHLATIAEHVRFDPEIQLIRTSGQSFSWRHKSPRSKKLIKKMGQINQTDVLTVGLAHTRKLFQATQGWKPGEAHDKDLWNEMHASRLPFSSLVLGDVTFEFCI